MALITDFTPRPVPKEAEEAAERLYTALEAVGLQPERDLPAGVRAGVTVSDEGFVALGRLPVPAADHLARVLLRAASCPEQPS